MGGVRSANHSMELSTRNVIVKEWTGLRTRSSVVDMAGVEEHVSRLLTDGFARQVLRSSAVCGVVPVSLGTAGGIERERL